MELLTNEEFIEMCRTVFFKTYKPGLILIKVYDCLVETGKLDKEDYLDPKVILDTENRFYQDAAKEGIKALKDLAHIKGTFLYKSVLEKECKKQSVANYFIKQKSIYEF